ncbi:hypothetical protein CV770_40735 [Bradyrhizobium sp. AC87j1]|nr:hypothetical protein CV770_40735 [Bradyrhizobium sp. AC87j1]
MCPNRCQPCPRTKHLTGASSTPQLFRIRLTSLEYWIARSSRAMTVERVARARRQLPAAFSAFSICGSSTVRRLSGVIGPTSL